MLINEIHQKNIMNVKRGKKVVKVKMKLMTRNTNKNEKPQKLRNESAIM